jgi:hypothetical protein
MPSLRSPTGLKGIHYIQDKPFLLWRKSLPQVIQFLIQRLKITRRSFQLLELLTIPQFSHNLERDSASSFKNLINHIVILTFLKMVRHGNGNHFPALCSSSIGSGTVWLRKNRIFKRNYDKSLKKCCLLFLLLDSVSN